MLLACSPEVTVTSSAPTQFVSPRGSFNKTHIPPGAAAHRRGCDRLFLAELDPAICWIHQSSGDPVSSSSLCASESQSSSHSSRACMATNRENEGQAWKIDILPRLPLPPSSAPPFSLSEIREMAMRNRRMGIGSSSIGCCGTYHGWEVPVCLWNVSHIGMFPFKYKGANHILAFCAGLSWFVVEVQESRTFEP